MQQINGNSITPNSYRHIKTHITPKLDPDYLRGTVLWLFWRKVLKLRRYRCLDRVVECFEIDGKLKARAIFRFKQRKTKRVFTVNLSKHEPIYFVVASRDGKVFQSEYCLDMREFEFEFMKFFYRRTPILPASAGVFTA